MKLPTRSPRHHAIASARLAISEAVAKAAEQHELTVAELFVIMSTVTTDWAWTCLRDERGGGE